MPTAVFTGLQTDRVLNELVSVDKELNNNFKSYLHNEYKADKSKRLDYIDIGQIASFLVDKLKSQQTGFFQSFFDKVEIILESCDAAIENLIVVGLFESIQNICGTEIDYHYVFNSWLKKLSKTKWDDLIDSWEGKEWRSKYKNNL
jgi:hypothetical protein